MSNDRFKFRAWNKKDEQMIYDWQFNIGIEYYGFNGGGVFEIMQWTGLQDRQGRDIYEGDIVRSQKGIMGVIKYESLGGICCYFIDLIDLGIKDGYLYSIEVLGNIYQNPELLKCPQEPS
jgi:hypothetical protein